MWSWAGKLQADHTGGSGHTVVVCVTLLTTRHQTTPDIDAVSEL